MRVVSFVTQKGGSGKSTTAAVDRRRGLSARAPRLHARDSTGRERCQRLGRKLGRSKRGPEFERIDATALDKALATLRGLGLRPRYRRHARRRQPGHHRRHASRRPLPRPLPADSDRSARLPADRSNPYTARQALRLRSGQCPPRSAAGRRDASRPRRPRLDRRAADRQPGGPSGRDGGRAGRDRVQRSGAAAAEIRRLWEWIDAKLDEGRRNVKAA